MTIGIPLFAVACLPFVVYAVKRCLTADGPPINTRTINVTPSIAKPCKSTADGLKGVLSRKVSGPKSAVSLKPRP